MTTPIGTVALIGVGLTALGLLLQAALFAFFLGKLSARVDGLEARMRLEQDNAAALAAIAATLHALKDSLDDLRVAFNRRFEAVEDSVQTLMMPRRPVRRGASGEG
jgi:hypothetical protein